MGGFKVVHSTRKIAALAKGSFAFHMHGATDKDWSAILDEDNPPQAMKEIEGFAANKDIRSALKSMVEDKNESIIDMMDTVLFMMNGVPLLCLLNTEMWQKPEGCPYKTPKKMLAFCHGRSIVVDIRDYQVDEAAKLIEPTPISTQSCLDFGFRFRWTLISILFILFYGTFCVVGRHMRLFLE